MREQLQVIESLEGKFSHQGLWKIKQKLCPAANDPPMAKKDEKGNIITAPEALKHLYLETYRKRLRQREMKSDYMDIYFLKSELLNSRLQYPKRRKTPLWIKN